MSYVDENLIAGEQVIYRTHLHWVVFVLPILVSLLLSLAAFALYSAESTRSIAWPLFILAALPILQAYIIRRCSEFAVTDKRILLKTGILRRHTMETLVTKVENIGVDQSVLGRILNYGTITVTGTGATKETFERIAAPLEFRKQVQTATLKREEQRK
jgi:uncharacterized membrane protein YdbT with pleckstrin-like domain